VSSNPVPWSLHSSLWHVFDDCILIRESWCTTVKMPSPVEATRNLFRLVGVRSTPSPIAGVATTFSGLAIELPPSFCCRTRRTARIFLRSSLSRRGSGREQAAAVQDVSSSRRGAKNQIRIYPRCSRKFRHWPSAAANSGLPPSGTVRVRPRSSPANAVALGFCH